MKEIIESKHVENLGKYLSILIRKEYAYDIVDQIGKAKDKNEFLDAIYKAMRLSMKSDISKRKVTPSNEDIKEVIKLIGEKEENLRFLSRYLASLAFSFWLSKEPDKEKASEEVK